MKFIAIDTETGGLNPEVHGLTEIAMVAFDFDPNTGNYNVLGEFVECVIPNEELAYCPKALDMQRRTFSSLETFGKPEKEVSDAAVAFIYKHLGGHDEWSGKFIAHYADFDYGFVSHFFARTEHNNLFPLKKRSSWVCTRNMARILWSLGIIDPAGLHQDQVADVYGISSEGRHTALADAKVCMEIFAGMTWSMRRMSQNKGVK